MNDAKNLFEYQLRMYVNLYFIIGVLETRLRKRIVITLSEFATKRNYAEWTKLVPKSFANSRSLQKLCADRKLSCQSKSHKKSCGSL